MSRAAWRSWFPAGVGAGMRPWGCRAARSNESAAWRRARLPSAAAAVCSASDAAYAASAAAAGLPVAVQYRIRSVASAVVRAV